MGARWSRATRLTVATAWAAGALLVLVAQPAHAPHVAQLQVTPDQVRPGDTVSVFGPRGYGKTTPVEIRLDYETGRCWAPSSPTSSVSPSGAPAR